jgi:hypothetical protein
MGGQSAMADNELGIFFDLKELSVRRYEAEAWEVFMRHADPEMLKGAQLFQGEVSGLLPDTGGMFCIAVRARDPLIIQYLKDLFASSGDTRLAPVHDRIRESDVIDKYELRSRGQIDSEGRLETNEWSRADQHLCKVTGWPYVPQTYPTHLSPALVDELESMSEPGRRKPISSDSLPGLKPLSLSSDATSSPGGGLSRIVVYVVIALIVGGLLLIGWLARGKISDYIGERKDELSLRLDLGSEAYEKVQDGFALAGIKKVPHDLDLAALNAKLSDRAYYFLHHKDESVYDVTTECMVWFAPSEKRDPSPETTIQAFIKINMKSLRGDPIWACQSKGVRSSPGTEKENPNLRHEALQAAVENLELACLADGRSVKSFQANNDFPGLKQHVQYMLANCKGGSTDSSKPKTRKGSAASAGTRLERNRLDEKLRKHLKDKWIMTNRIYLKNGKKFSALILDERGLSLNLRSTTGKTSIPKSKIKEVEPFGEEQFAKEIDKLLEPLRKGFKHEWEHNLCDELVDELTEKCMTYGPPFPGAHVLKINSDAGAGKVNALVKVGKGRRTLKNGDTVEGFKVIGIDAETRSVLVRMGQKGEILRIWPKT